jgi:hypothetical protein
LIGLPSQNSRPRPRSGDRPAGGQGRNTGIQEGINLAWKVALVMQGLAGDVLLDNHDAERRPIEKEVITRTDKIFRIVAAHGGVLAFFRDHLVPLVGDTGPVRRFITDFVSELGIDYRSRPLTLADRLDARPAPDITLPTRW